MGTSDEDGVAGCGWPYCGPQSRAGREERDLGRPFGRNGDVYRWLWANYEFVKEWRARYNPGWRTIAERIGRNGVMGSRGKPPTERSVWKVWQRVCRDVKRQREREAAEQAARAAAADQRRHYPSRLPKDLRPRVVAASQGAVVPVEEAGGSSAVEEGKKPWDGMELPPEQRRRLEATYARMERKAKWEERRYRRLPEAELAELKSEFGEGRALRRMKAPR